MAGENGEDCRLLALTALLHTAHRGTTSRPRCKLARVCVCVCVCVCVYERERSREEKRTYTDGQTQRRGGREARERRETN